MSLIGDILGGILGGGGPVSGDLGNSRGYTLVKDSAGTIWLVKTGTPVPYGIQSIPIATAGDGSIIGTSLSRGLKYLKATADQAQGIQQAVDSGAIEQGSQKVGAPLGQAHGTTLPKFGQRPSGSEAVATGPSLGGLGDLIQSVSDFLGAIVWLFHPLNFLRAAEFLLGILVSGYGIWLLTNRSGRGLASTAISATPVGRVIRVRRGARMGRHEGQRESARMEARQRETRSVREASANERELINRDARENARNS